MGKIKEPIVILDPLELHTEEDLCGNCKYKNSFLCDKRYADGIVDYFFKQYDIKIYVYEFNIKITKRKILDFIHDQELYHHRQGGYFALQCTNFHCGESCECDCDKERCWDFEKVPSRRQPHCIKFFGLKIPEKYCKNNYAFILGNLEFEEVNSIKEMK